MPYILICTENIWMGETTVLDGQKDYELMEYLRQLYGSTDVGGNTILEQPVNVLNGAEIKGYRVINTVVQGDTIIWTLHKE